MVLLIVVAFIAGVVTVVSPCVLPVLPLLLSTSVGGGRGRPWGIVLGLVLTFTAATLLVTAAAAALAVPIVWLRAISLVAIALLGLTMVVPPLGRAFERLASPLVRLVPATANQRSDFWGGLLIGAGLGLVWAPCVGPVMGTVMGITAAQGVTGQAVAITLAYSLGCALPMLLIAYGARNFAARVKGWTVQLRAAFGVMAVVAAVAILLGFDTRLQDLATGVFPGWNQAVTGVERQASVDQELGQLQATAVPQQPSESTKVMLGVTMASEAAAPTATSAPPAPTPVPPTAAPTFTAALPDLGPAPELIGISGWFNTPGDKPLTLADLRGKVVLIDFWTFECYNCRNTRPYVRALYDKYRSMGLEIIGVHTPEFATERVPSNIKAAAREQGVTWPIAMDPDYKTWNAYQNQYWPNLYFIDAKGHLRAMYIGEGNYDKKEYTVQQLLAEAKAAR